MSWNNGTPGPWGPPGGGSKGDDDKSGGRRPVPGPWNPGGRGAPGPFGGALPDLDGLIAQLQGARRRWFGGGRGGGGGGGRGWGPWLQGARGVGLLALVVLGIWLASGFYRVQTDEEGVVMRFGAFTRTTPPGLNYHLPWPIETAETPAVTRINRIDIGYRSGAPDPRGNGRDLPSQDVPAESLMLTGDENIIDIGFTVFWRIADAPKYLFNVRHPRITIKAVAESMMREVMGRTPIQPALTDARASIEQAVTVGTQAILDHYNEGVEITQVQLQKVDPPAAVIDSFRDVQRANTEAERAVNEAEAYRNNIVPRARGDAARITAEADGARQAAIAEATGQGQRFLSVLAAYQAAKDITLRRLYIETMQQVLSHTPSVVIDDRVRGLLPFLQLGAPSTAKPPAVPPAPASGGPAPLASAAPALGASP